MIDPRTPVLVGCGQITDTTGEPSSKRSRVAFCAEAANVALEDTKHAQAVYEPAPTVRQSVLEAYPQIKDILAPAFAALNGPTLRALNSKIAVDGGDPKTVATDWLQSKKLL